MPEISFYQLTRHSPEMALLRLLERAVATGKHAVVRFNNEEDVDAFDTALWAIDQDSFLPHGTQKSKVWEEQPVFLTDSENNPNNADFIFIMPSAPDGKLDNFERVFFIFEGRNESQVKTVREKWKTFKNKGDQLTYWAQTDSGGWEKKQ